MGNHKRRQPGDLSRNSKWKRAHRKVPEHDVYVPHDLVTKRPLPVVKSKHRSYFEFVENSDKKKKLQIENTLNPNPPHGFEFVVVGNPELTSACKELSRERGLMIFIVAKSGETASRNLASQMNRVGYHFHATIVKEAKASIHHVPDQVVTALGKPEPIPESQDLYYAQADAVLRDLFPRVPNTDRQTIILRSFTKGALYNGETPVGRTRDLTLSRRVQLAVLAHIRHQHTLYDDLLRRMPWHVARKAVQPACLDILVKWRGDEESGRDQLDEILREVVIISDSEDEDTTEDSTDDTSVASSTPTPSDAENTHHRLPMTATGGANVAGGGRNDRRGFERYRRAWDDAVRRNGERRHDAVGSFHFDVDAAFHEVPEPRMTHDVPGDAPAPNGFVRPGMQVYRAGAGVIAAEVNVYARRDGDAGSRLPWLPSGSANPDMLVRSADEVGQPRLMPEAYSRPGTGAEHPLVRSMQYYYGSSPSPAQPPRDGWQADGHAHAGGLRAASPVQTSGCDGGRYEMRSRLARVDEAPASFTQPAAERIVVKTARPGSRLNPIVMEDRGGFYERVANPENVELLSLNDGVSSQPQGISRACPRAELGSYRSPSPMMITTNTTTTTHHLGHASHTLTPPWRADQRNGFVHYQDEDYRLQRYDEEELRFQLRSRDGGFRHQQRGEEDVFMDDECVFIRQKPLNHIDLT